MLNRHLVSVRVLHRQLARATTAIDALFDPDRDNYAFLMNQDRHYHPHVRLVREGWGRVPVVVVPCSSVVTGLALSTEDLQRAGPYGTA
ncbi:MAG: hypothetical protein M3281_02480 [Chloroflexota bacterium]|nr:hypothetical protein [Chloroflexota bacterium]